jgi:hypothetical protein
MIFDAARRRSWRRRNRHSCDAIVVELLCQLLEEDLSAGGSCAPRLLRIEGRLRLREAAARKHAHAQRMLTPPTRTITQPRRRRPRLQKPTEAADAAAVAEDLWRGWRRIVLTDYRSGGRVELLRQLRKYPHARRFRHRGRAPSHRRRGHVRGHLAHRPSSGALETTHHTVNQSARHNRRRWVVARGPAHLMAGRP